MKRLWLMVPILWVGCAEKEEAPPKPVVAVKLAKVGVADIPLTVRVQAAIFPREQANISARVTAPIKALKARKGDSVVLGQVLAELENRDTIAQREEADAAVIDAQANLQKTTSGTLPTDVEHARGQLSSAEAALSQAQKNYDRRSELFKQGAIPGRDLLASETELAQAKTAQEVAKRSLDLLQNQSRDKDIRIAESRVAQAQARASLAEAQLQYSTLRSPFNGTITEQFMYPGDMAKPDAPMFTLMDLSTVVARGQAPEAETGRLKSGQACSFTPADASDASGSGRITVINKAVDPARRTVEIWCEIPNAGSKLRAGTFGTLSISTGMAVSSVVAPVPAVQFNEGTRNGAVMVVDEKHIAHKRDVEGGEIVDGKVQITKGLKAGEMIVAEGGYGLPDGAEVKPAQDAKPAEGAK
jgi:HlyD family secretion protein